MAFSQTDSTYYFSKEQVKVFLTTKVELDNCVLTSLLIQSELVVAKQDNVDYIEDIIAKEKKLRRTRLVATGGILGTVIFALITFIK